MRIVFLQKEFDNVYEGLTSQDNINEIDNTWKKDST